MPEDDREFQKRWKVLAERISKEHDRSKITELSQERIKALDDEIKKLELEHKHSHKKSA